MGNSAWNALRGLVCLLLLSVVLTADAVDLKPVDVISIRVGTCDQQVRFKVRLSLQGSEYDQGNKLASYRISVYSTRHRKLLTNFSVTDHEPDSDLAFVVPSDLLACETGVRILVDDQKKVAEINNSNNSATVKWKPPGKTFGSPCAAILDNCPGK